LSAIIQIAGSGWELISRPEPVAPGVKSAGDRDRRFNLIELLVVVAIGNTTLDPNYLFWWAVNAAQKSAG
jgi:hypothetical protein